MDHGNLYMINRNLFYAIHYSPDDGGYWWEAFDQDGKDIATSDDIFPSRKAAQINAHINLEKKKGAEIHQPECPHCFTKFHWSDAERLDIPEGTYHQCPNCGEWLCWSLPVYPVGGTPSWAIPYNQDAIRKAKEN